MAKLFKSQEEAVTWIYRNIAIAVRPKHEDKTKLVFPFISAYSHKQVVENLAKELFKYQEETFK